MLSMNFGIKKYRQCREDKIFCNSNTKKNIKIIKNCTTYIDISITHIIHFNPYYFKLFNHKVAALR